MARRGSIRVARSESFASLAACLDALEATAADIGAAAPSGLDAELAGLFDEDDLRLQSLLPPAGERRGLRRAGAAVGVVLALLGAWAVIGIGTKSSPAAAPAAPPAAEPVPVDPGTLVNAAHPPPRHHKPAKPRAHPRRPAGVRHHRPDPATHAAAPTAQPPPTIGGGTSTNGPPPTAPPASPRPPEGGGTTLPDPGGVTTLPPPAP